MLRRCPLSLLSREFRTFAGLCRDGATLAAQRGRPVLVSSTFETPPISVAERLRWLGDHSGRTFVWASSWSGERRLAVGTALDLTGHGLGRFEQISDAWRQCSDGALVDGIGSQPSVLGGFSFAPLGPRRGVLPDALMWLPAAQLVERPGATAALSLNAWVVPGSDGAGAVQYAKEAAGKIMTGSANRTDPQPRLTAVRETPSAVDWKFLLHNLLDEIDAGTFAKLVLARQMIADFDRPVRVAPKLATLVEKHDIGVTFGAQLDDRWFLGSTPECLLYLHGECAETHGLAGSAPRDPDPQRDIQFAGRLQSHPRLLSEHAIVTDFVQQTLRQFFRDVQLNNDEPVLKLADVQHRQTGINATHFARPVDLLRLAAALHPTPAVGGFPRTPALDWLHSHEPVDRGWYAAPIGWARSDGGGEFAVAIRSALATGTTATLYAGCGIVGGADADEEYAESCLKMQTMGKVFGLASNIWAAS